MITRHPFWRYMSLVLTGAMIAAFSAFLILPAYAQPTPKMPAFVKGIKQIQFASPQKAFDALVNAAANDDARELLYILGPEGKDVISSGDPVADTAARARFSMEAAKGVSFRQLDKNAVLAEIGADGWTFPIPLVKKGDSWVFLTEEGKQEIIDRRIGRNELNTISASLAYVDAQREYAQVNGGGGHGVLYAQNFISHEGSHDGLYWPGHAGSPLGPFFARADCGNGSSSRNSEKPVPYYGYYYRILKRQGSHAPGGEMDYVSGGKMTSGFGLIAYPARYGVSGVMTFIVNQQGIVYEKDLGPNTEQIANTIKAYDPDETWKKVDVKEASLN